MNTWEARSWVPVAKDSHFPLQNLPLGIFSTSERPRPRVGVALGEKIIDLSVLQAQGFLDELALSSEIFAKEVLNSFLARGKKPLQALRKILLQLFDAQNDTLQSQSTLHAQLLLSQKEATLHLPVSVGDYTDFYSSMEHASNVGSLFRDPKNPLLPNWKHIPVGYHGRASSIVLSGVPIRRPVGQRRPPNTKNPLFGPSKQLDFELEMAFVTCGSSHLGERISVEKAEEYIAGLLLFNDWSARDIQAWEYVPLGPFLGKNFASSVSPWLVTLEALAPFRREGPVQDPPPLPYLQSHGKNNFDIHLEAHLQLPHQPAQCISRSNFKYMYWNIRQQLAHHTIGGCNIRAGDMYASGTISGPTPDSYGSMLELSWRGERPLSLPGAQKRSFLEDGDRLMLQGYAEQKGLRIGFGEVQAEILPAQPWP